MIGFINWNRFCDRIDTCLEPLRTLAEENPTEPDHKKEEAGKTTALEGMQEACEKLSERYQSLNFTLYCPFHSILVSNWHIQLTADNLTAQNHEPEIVRQLSETASSTDETEDTGAQNAEQTQSGDLPQPIIQYNVIQNDQQGAEPSRQDATNGNEGTSSQDEEDIPKPEESTYPKEASFRKTKSNPRGPPQSKNGSMGKLNLGRSKSKLMGV